ncbi:HAMP domain-containing sensor histidine kinase [Parapedobacter lycopersici]|uniref:sensor histidine kinase n=1 Tax=Parapedobacter lycopersici TaxID=1864939 RepID=UPI00333EC6F8
MRHKKSIGLIIGLMTIALLGVVAMQYFFIRQSYIQKAQLFDESVNAALTTVASKAEKREVMEFAMAQQHKNREKYEREQRRLKEQLRIQTDIEHMRDRQAEYYLAFKQQEQELYDRFPVVIPIESNEFYETYIKDERNQEFLQVNVDVNSVADGTFQRSDNTVRVYATKPVPMQKAKDDSLRYLIILGQQRYAARSLNYTVKALPPRKDIKMERQIDHMEQQLKLLQANTLLDTIAVLSGKDPLMVEGFAAEIELAKRPFNERINAAYIKNELQRELIKRDIRSPFNLEIKNNNHTVYSFASFSEVQPASESVYSTALFQADSEQSPGRLSIYFPSKSAILMSNMAVMLFSSVALLLVLVGCFAYTIFTMVRQKKISEMKTDFINNMTHEFKTPVATIMIASESLKDPEISADQSRLQRLAGIIYDENVRLGSHIERVLNIARLEKDNLKLEHQEVDINELAQAVIDSMDLQLQKHGAQVHMHLDASDAIVVGDELHLSNVLFNLVDNAIKYSKGDPEITVRTKTIGKQLMITVTDNGIGMNKDQLAKIFDQFYRIPTGNRHDVKGFGLGLSYVNDIVKRLGGKVQVKSDKDKGTTFDVILPLKG